jgi:hypothetical protein
MVDAVERIRGRFIRSRLLMFDVVQNVGRRSLMVDLPVVVRNRSRSSTVVDLVTSIGHRSSTGYGR